MNTGSGETPHPKEFQCPYCSESLDRRYHFCVSCGAVYREPDAKTYREEPPHLPSVQTRIARDGRSSLNFFFLLAIGLTILSTLQAVVGRESIDTFVLLQDAFIATVTSIYAWTHRSEIAYLFRSFRNSSVFFVSLPILAGLLLVNKVYHELLLQLLEMEQEDTLIDMLRQSMSPPVLCFTICVFPAIFEELGFRGIVQERLVRVGGFWLGISATSVLFVILHFSVVSAPYLFLLSLMFCWVRERTRSLYPVMVLHFLHNAIVLAYFVRENP